MAKTEGKRERGTREGMGRVPLYIGSRETAERYGPHPEAWAQGAAQPGWGRAWKRLQAHSVAVQAALDRSTDRDAQNARLIAAHLTWMADEFEALDAENSLLPEEERPGAVPVEAVRLQVRCEFPGDVARPIVTEQPRPMDDRHAIDAGGGPREVEGVGHVGRAHRRPERPGEDVA